MEDGAHPSAPLRPCLQQGAHPAVDLGVTFRRLGDTGEDLEPCTELIEGMPTTSPRCTSKETSFSAQIVSVATADDWPRTTEDRRRKGAPTASVNDSRIVL